MESRTRLAIGGMATVAASVTVICVVALTNSLSLADSAGSPIGAAPVVIPASGAAAPSASPATTPTPKATPSPTPAPLQPVSQATTDPQTAPATAEVVPAPDAKVVTPTRSAPVGEAAVPSSLKDALAQVEATGSWEPLRAWAESRGWSSARIDRFIAKLERAHDGSRSGGERESGGIDGTSGGTGGSDSQRAQIGSADRDERRGPGRSAGKERPAHAGANADDRSHRSGHGEKKDRWRDSPQWRDR